MNTKRLAAGTVAGAATWTAAGYVMFGVIFANFYAYALSAGSATGVLREPVLPWAVGLAALSYASLVTLAIGAYAGAPTVGTGLRIGAVVGFLVWFTADFMLYGISHVLNVRSILIDPLLEIVPSAIAGGVIAVVLGKIR
jgi:hypothetical protein